jgi:diguanylate cyclase (GGDEF)-like protein
VLVVGDVGQLFYSNRAARALLGDLYVGKPMLSVLRAHRLAPAAGLSAAHDLDRVVIGGSLFRQNVIAPRAGSPGQASRVFWLRKYGEEEMRIDRAGRDALTGLYNRKSFERDLRRQVHEATSNAPVSLALWSLDHFKETCEQYGDRVGDDLLREFANAIGDRIRPDDGFYRLDGETFAIIYPGADASGAESAVQRVLYALSEQTIEAGDMAFRISASVGLTTARLREVPAALMARADAALYSAKDGGGNCCVTAGPEER